MKFKDEAIIIIIVSTTCLDMITLYSDCERGLDIQQITGSQNGAQQSFSNFSVE